MVVLGAQQSPVLDRSGAAVGVFDDVVDLAVLGGDVTCGVLAHAVSDFDGATPSAGEEPLGAGHVDGLAGWSEDDAFEVGFEQKLGNFEP